MQSRQITQIGLPNIFSWRQSYWTWIKIFLILILCTLVCSCHSSTTQPRSPQEQTLDQNNLLTQWIDICLKDQGSPIWRILIAQEWFEQASNEQTLPILNLKSYRQLATLATSPINIELYLKTATPRSLSTSLDTEVENILKHIANAKRASHSYGISQNGYIGIHFHYQDSQNFIYEGFVLRMDPTLARHCHLINQEPLSYNDLLLLARYPGVAEYEIWQPVFEAIGTSLQTTMSLQEHI